MSWPTLMILGGTYAYLRQKVWWENELSSLSLSCLHKSDKLGVLEQLFMVWGTFCNIFISSHTTLVLP